MDGVVDFFDITQILGYKYNTNQQASYTDGDLDYSGKVDFFDIVLLLSANYNSGQTYLGARSAAPTLSSRGHLASTPGSAVPASTTRGTYGDDKPDFYYESNTGHLYFLADQAEFTTIGGQPSFVCSLTISSASGILQPSSASQTFAGGTGATLTSTLLSSALTISPGFTDWFDIGGVLPTNLSESFRLSDLTVKYQVLNGGGLKTSDIVFLPEPSTFRLGIGAAALLLRRRRQRPLRRG
jgi:hypothetical protein